MFTWDAMFCFALDTIIACLGFALGNNTLRLGPSRVMMKNVLYLIMHVQGVDDGA